VGAWIETSNVNPVILYLMSRPAWARGLKLEVDIKENSFFEGRALRGRVD